MTQFHVYRLANRQLVMDLQADVTAIASRVVAPLRPATGAMRSYDYLEPVLDLDGDKLVLHTAEMLAVEARRLAGPPVADMSHRRADIIRAIDMLFTGV